jgi:hypothetical protein
MSRSISFSTTLAASVGRIVSSENEADKETLIRNMLSGEYEKPVRVVAFNTSEGWSRDVSEDIAREVCQRARETGQQLPFGTKVFAEYQLGEDCQV